MAITNSPEQENNSNLIDASILRRFGLTSNDIAVYKSLFKIGRTKTGPIIKETAIANSRVYASLQNLMNRGLVSYQVKNNVKYYQAELPSELIERSRKDAERLSLLSKTLSQLPIIHKSRNETNTYEGVRGLKMAYQKHIEGLEPGEIASIMVFVGPEFSNSVELRKFFSETVDRDMIKKKCNGRMITNKIVSDIIKKDRPNPKIYDIRYLSPRFRLPYALNLSKKEVMISVWSDNPVVFSIQNPVVVEAFQTNFDYMWSQAKR